jgi:hypothetical protein
MTPVHQILAQWQQQVGQITSRFQQTLEEASAGCRQLVDRNPTDIAPLRNVFGAIDAHRKEVEHALSDAWRQTEDGLEAAGDGRANVAHDEGERQYRYAAMWLEEQWMRFEGHWNIEQVQAMWPHAQAALQRPAPCARCGQPMQLATRAQAQTVACPACRAQNQVAADPVCAIYFGMADSVALGQTVDRWLAKRRHELSWEDQRVATHQRTGQWPEEPVESLKQLERLELDYQQALVSTRSQMDPCSPEQQRSFVEGRMRPFYDRMNRNAVWRRAHGMPPLDVAATEGAVDWGPLRPEAIDDFYFHQMLLEWLQGDDALYAKALARLGYRDATHWKIVERTFLEHWGDDEIGSDHFQEAASRAVARAMNERGALMAQANSHLLNPIEGVSIETVAGLMARVGSTPEDGFVKLLAGQGLGLETWARVSKAWMARMSSDTTGTIATAYSKAFTGAGQGQFGEAGKAVAAATGAGGMATDALGGEAPVSFERYAEISGAMAAWAKQGKDISAGLHACFRITAQDFSTISVYWSAKMADDFSLFDRMTELTNEYEKQYLASA